MVKLLPVTNITGATARLRGDLIDNAGWATTVYFFWGTEDLGPRLTGWPNRVPIGVRTRGTLELDVSGLSPGTTYAYRIMAAASRRIGWTGAGVFTTGESPELAILPAEDITTGGATLGAEVFHLGADTEFSVYWGPSDAGTNAGAWPNSAALGATGGGALSYAGCGWSTG